MSAVKSSDADAQARLMELINQHGDIVQSGLMTTMVLSRAGAAIVEAKS